MSSLHSIKDKISRHFGDSLAPDQVYLSYHDVTLTKLDVDSIRHDWLTDNAICFWEEYLEHEKLKEYPKAQIILLRPSMSFMLMQSPDPLSLKGVLPNFDKTTHIFLPINDNTNVEVAEGGSHWSLLVVSIIDGVAFHYDSLGGCNDEDAAVVTKKLSILLNKHLRFVSMDDAPQQENGSDCGVYVCLCMQHLLLRRLLKRDSKQKITMSMRGRNLNAPHARKEMIKIIQEFRKDAQKRSRSASPFGKSHSKSPPRIGDD